MKSVESFVLHPTVICTLPVDTFSIPIENLVINFESRSATLDFGSRCYLKRDNSNRKIGKSSFCDISSLCERRKSFITSVVILFSNHSINKIKKNNTIYGCARTLMLFIDWVDKSSKSNIFEDVGQVKAELKTYFSLIEQKVKVGQIGNNTAAYEQKNLIYFFNEFFEINLFQVRMRLLRVNSKLSQSTQVPDEDNQKKVLALTKNLFDGITRFVTEFERYPFSIDMPTHLDWEDPKLWFFPTIVKFMAPETLLKRSTLKRRNLIFDYKSGRLLNKKEVYSEYAVSLSQQNFNLAINAIQSANENQFDHHRRSLALLAHNCFLVHFQAVTGMNLAQVIDLKWGDNYTINPEMQGFRGVKARANDKDVSFSITTKFIEYLRKYLELRKYLLNENREFEFLFMSFKNPPHLPLKLNGNQACKSLFNILQKIDPNIQKITSKNWRAAKFDYLINNTDISTSALIMQNSEKTLLKHYAEGSPTKTAEEMSLFFESLSGTVCFEKPPKKHINISVGECDGFGKPSKIDIKINIEPNCKLPEGCLFCQHYKVHADSKDVRKLLSLKFCILRTKHLSQNLEYFESIFGQIIKRIDDIVDFIAGHTKEFHDIVQLIKNEVFEEGRLDSYWAVKYEMLTSLGYANDN